MIPDVKDDAVFYRLLVLICAARGDIDPTARARRFLTETQKLQPVKNGS